MGQPKLATSVHRLHVRGADAEFDIWPYGRPALGTVGEGARICSDPHLDHNYGSTHLTRCWSVIKPARQTSSPSVSSWTSGAEFAFPFSRRTNTRPFSEK